MVLIPVVVGFAVNWSAFTCAVLRIEEEVVRTLLRTADALTNVLVENLIILTSFRCALACAVIDVEILVVGASVGNGWVAFALAGLVVPVKIRFTRIIAGGFGANAVANRGVEVMRSCALAWGAQAAARHGIEVLVRKAFMAVASALALTVTLVPLGAFTTCQGFALAIADVLVPDITRFTRLNFALEFAASDVPRVLIWLSRVLLRLADTRARGAVPDEAWVAVVADVASASACVKVEEMVVCANTLDASAFTGKCVKLLKFVVTMSHHVSTRTVNIIVPKRSPDELSFWTEDEIVRDRISARQKFSINDGY
jgi:hypothetical protein